MSTPTLPVPDPPQPQPLPQPEPLPPVFLDRSVVTGQATITLLGPDGAIKSRQTACNLITDVGDSYAARRIAAGVAPNAPADVAATVTGMKLGTGTTPPAKAGTGAALGAFVAGSAKVFDTGFPLAVDQGSGAGWTVNYQCTFGPGAGTAPALTECAMVVDAAANATSTAANTVARLTFAAVPKNANDTLVFEWQHLQLGA